MSGIPVTTVVVDAEPPRSVRQWWAGRGKTYLRYQLVTPRVRAHEHARTAALTVGLLASGAGLEWLWTR